MRIYYYLLFRIYHFYTDVFKEQQSPLSYTSAVSTILIFVNLITIQGLLEQYNIILPIYLNNYFVLIVIVSLWAANHYLLVKPKKFLEYNFRKDFLGGVMIIFYIAITAISFIWVANLNREKIFQEKDRQKTEARQIWKNDIKNE